MSFCLKSNAVLASLEKSGKNKIEMLHFLCEIFIYIHVEIPYTNLFKLLHVGYCVGYKCNKIGRRTTSKLQLGGSTEYIIHTITF